MILSRTYKRRGKGIVEDALNDFTVVIIWPRGRVPLYEWELPIALAKFCDVDRDSEILGYGWWERANTSKFGNSLNFATGAGTHRDVVTLLHGVLT